MHIECLFSKHERFWKSVFPVIPNNLWPLSRPCFKRQCNLSLQDTVEHCLAKDPRCAHHPHQPKYLSGPGRFEVCLKLTLQPAVDLDLAWINKYQLITWFLSLALQHRKPQVFYNVLGNDASPTYSKVRTSGVSVLDPALHRVATLSSLAAWPLRLRWPSGACIESLNGHSMSFIWFICHWFQMADCHCVAIYAICPANGLVQTAFEHVQLLLEPSINFGLVRSTRC